MVFDKCRALRFDGAVEWVRRGILADDERDLQAVSREEVASWLATRKASVSSTARMQTRSEGGDCNIEGTKGAIAARS